jgi:RNA polymerase sigma factor (sigma-70 family)
MTDNQKDNVCGEIQFKQIFIAYSEDLYKFLYYKYGADNNPEDLVQEAFTKLWQNCSKVIPAKAKSFLYTVANNQMLNEIAKRKTAFSYTSTQEKRVNVESPEYLMEEGEYKDSLERALATLSEDQRVTFLLNRVEGKKHQEIADMLGISRKAVEKRIYTALQILRQKMEGL